MAMFPRCGRTTPKQRTTRRAGLVAALVLMLSGCASAGKECDAGNTRGWFSGWGTGGASAFSLGLLRTWDECDARTAVPGRRKPEPFVVPSPDPASESATSPGMPR